MTSSVEVDDAVVNWIDDYRGVNGYSPTVREVGDAFGWSSSSTAMVRLQRLERQGRISWKPSQARTLTVVRKS